MKSNSKSWAAILFMQSPHGDEGMLALHRIPHEDDKDRLRSILTQSVVTSGNADCSHGNLLWFSSLPVVLQFDIQQGGG